MQELCHKIQQYLGFNGHNISYTYETHVFISAAGELESTPGLKARYSSDWSPVNHRAHIDKLFALKFTPVYNLEPSLS